MSPGPCQILRPENLTAPATASRRCTHSGGPALRRTLRRRCRSSARSARAPCGTRWFAPHAAPHCRASTRLPAMRAAGTRRRDLRRVPARPPPFAAAFAAFVYAFPLDRLLHAFKYGGRLAHADFFAAALAQRVAQRPAGLPWPDALVARAAGARAPARARLRPGRAKSRAASPRMTGVPLHAGAPHARYARRRRRCHGRRARANVRGAFAADRRLAGHARRDRRRRDDHRRHARRRGARRCCAPAPRSVEAWVGRAYTSAGAAMKAAMSAAQRSVRCSPSSSSIPKSRRTPAT